MAEQFEGFANAPVDKKGKRLDFRDVDAYVDETEAGQVRDSSQTTVSTVVTGKPQPEVDETPESEPDSSNPTTAKVAEGKEASGS